MNFKHLLTAATALSLCACSGNGTVSTKLTEVGDGSAVCPAANVINDVSLYRNDHPAANDDTAAWLAENGARDSVITTSSGLQYQIVQQGNSAGPSPTGGQIIKVNYHGFFPNGTTFDSSYDRGQAIEFPANRVIQGWIEGLGMMKPCDAWTLYVPSNLAYGTRGTGGIPPNSLLGFHVQLLEVK